MSTLTTSLALHVEQILSEGARADLNLKERLRCYYCDQEALWMLATGADPEPLPHCGAHAADMTHFAASTMESMSP